MSFLADLHARRSTSTRFDGTAPTNFSSFEDIKSRRRLIAAAPELLEALRLAESSLSAASHPDCGSTPGDPLHTIRAAIAKASGESS